MYISFSLETGSELLDVIIRSLSDVEIRMNEKERLTSARSSETPCLLYLGPW